MQRFTYWLLILVSLYVSACTSATRTPPAVVEPMPVPVAAPAPVPAPEPAPPAAPASEPVTTASIALPSVTIEPLTVIEASSQIAAVPAPHLALLLPLKSTFYGKHAEAVQQGFLAAAVREANGLPVRVYACNDEASEIGAMYRQALQAGAVAVAGPLTRNGVAALAKDPDLTTPTLALNVLDNAQRRDQLYFFGLPAELEARQSAQRASAAGLLSTVIISSNTPLSKRLAQAFADEWQRSGGIIQGEIVYDGDPAALKDLPLDAGNSAFIAAEADKARLLRPYIHFSLPVYATSQVFSGNGNTLANYDIANVRFVDMPWMLQADHPAVMTYARPAAPLPPDQERLYALGIDAYRLLQLLFDHSTARRLPLDGVTGKITLDGHQFQREAMLAVIRDGLGVPLDSKPQR